MEYVPRQGVLDVVSASRPYQFEAFRNRLRLENRTIASCAAALAALAIHISLLAPVLWAAGVSQHRQAQQYRGDVADLQWVVLADSPGHSAIMKPQPPGSPVMTPIGVTDALPALPVIPSPAEPLDSNNTQPDGESSLGALYGRYLGQIQARIERAWQRPRTAIGAPIFQCRVEIDQDSTGRVQATTLVACNGDPRWQLSLVQAIQAASPLPAPPNPAVFVHHVLLAFRAMAYSPSAAAQLYAPPSVARVNDEPNEGDSSSQNAIEVLREAAQARTPRVLKLQIEGSRVDVEPERQ